MCLLSTYHQIIYPFSKTKEYSMKAKYCPIFLKCMLDVVNSEKPVEIFIKELNEKYLFNLRL